MNLFLSGLLILLATACHAEDHQQDGENTEQQMTIDQMIASAMTVHSMDYLTDLDGKTVMQEMDMVLTIDQWRSLQEEDKASDPETTSRQKRKAVKSSRYRWTNKVIPYRIAPGVFDRRASNEIQKAMDEWQRYTCLRFTRRSSQGNYVYFDNGSGCYSYVGMTGGPQTIGLAGGCRYKGVIVHEIGHAVGFHHEQNRPDRDSYVRIRRENIPSNLYHNFKKYPYSAVNIYDVPYDYGSVMHYGGTAFSTNGRLTIETLRREDQRKIGNRKGLSFRDIKLANRMYSCNEGCSSGIKCPGEGFVGKDCKCYCPGNPIQLCSGTTGTGGKTRPTTRRPVVTTKPSCRNLNNKCDYWAENGYCRTSSYMHMYCKASCNLCKTRPTKPRCKDGKEHCGYWKGMGFCSGEYKSFMKDHCKLSCGYCRLTTSFTTNSTETEIEVAQGNTNSKTNSSETDKGVAEGETNSTTDNFGTGKEAGQGGYIGRNGSSGITSGICACLSSVLMLVVALLPPGL